MHPGPSSPPWEEGWWTEERLGAVSSDIPRECAFCPVVIPIRHPGYGAQGLVHVLVLFAHGDIINFSDHCLIAAVEVQVILPTIPGLLLFEEATTKRGKLAVLDFGLDIFCHTADS